MRARMHMQKGLNTISTQYNTLSLVRLVFSPVHTIITGIVSSLLSIGYSSLNNDCSFLQTLTMTLIILFVTLTNSPFRPHSLKRPYYFNLLGK